MSQLNRRELLRALSAGAAGAIAAPLLLPACQDVPDAATAGAAAAPPLALVRSIAVRRGQDRGGADRGWLKAKHSFSFADYRDPAHMGFRALRVLNEDVIQGEGGFGMHPHRDMEIVTYVLDGALKHNDSEGNGSIIRPGEVQAMSAGTGIWHSEMNPSSSPVHLLQIWLVPDRRSHKPRYQQQVITGLESAALRVIASPTGGDGAVALHQDATIHACKLKAHEEMVFEVKPTRHAWVQVARGAMTLNGRTLHAGDGASTGEAGWLQFSATQPSELLLFDLA